jgi:ribose transport system substrate-binding protein
MKIKFRLIVGTAALFALASQCHAQQGEVVALFTKNQTNPFFQAVRLGAESAAKQMNARIVHYVPTKPDSISEQMSQVEDAIVKKPDVIVFIPVDYKAMAPAVAKMNASRIPVINLADRSETGDFVSYVGSSEYDLARNTARYLIQALSGKGNLVAIEGVKGAPTAIDRMRGFNDAVKEAGPGIKVVATQPGNYQRLQALQVMENLIQAHPQIDGVFAANDAMAAGVVEALEGARRKALVVGVNGTREAIDSIKSGKMLASAGYNGFLQGCVGTMTAIRALRKMPIEKEIIFAPPVINQNNVKQFEELTEMRSCPDWESAIKR